MINIAVKKRLAEFLVQTKLIDVFGGFYAQYKDISPIFTVGKVTFVTSWREGFYVKKWLLDQPELKKWPSSLVHSNWKALTFEAMVDIVKNPQEYRVVMEEK